MSKNRKVITLSEQYAQMVVRGSIDRFHKVKEEIVREIDKELLVRCVFQDLSTETDYYELIFIRDFSKVEQIGYAITKFVGVPVLVSVDPKVEYVVNFE